MIQKKKKGKTKETIFIRTGKCLTTGILSLSPGSGGMHLGLMLANYLTSKKRLKGAVVVSSPDVLSALWNTAGEEEPVIQGVRFFLYEQSEIAGIMNQGFQFVIFVFNGRKEGHWEEFLRCQRCFVVENFSEWRQEQLTGFVENNRKFSGFGQWRFFYVFGPKDYVKEIAGRTGVSIEKIPWNQDAFSVLRESFTFLESLA